MSLPSSPRRGLAVLSVAALLAGCASILGDFSAGDAGSSADGGPQSEAGGDAGAGDATAPPADSSTSDASTDALDATTGEDAGPDADAGNPVTPDSGDAGSDAAPDSGPDAGHDAGLDAGHNAGLDAGHDSGVNAGHDSGPAWTPAVLNQAGVLAAWLEASSANLVISTGLVESWKDLSKNKNDASNPNTGPVVIASAINGHNALHFTDFNMALNIADTASLQFGTDQIYIAAVAKVTKGTPYFFSKVTVGFGGAGSFYQSGLQFIATTATAGGATVLAPQVDIDSQIGDEVNYGGPCFEDGKFHVVALRRTSGLTVALTVDDKAEVNANVGDFDESQVGQNIGVGSVAYGNISPATDFEIAEIVMVHPPSGVIADADVASVHGYLKTKYGL